MGILFRAVVTGFGLSLGSAIYKQVSKRLGLEEGDDNVTKVEGDEADESDGDGESRHDES